MTQPTNGQPWAQARPVPAAPVPPPAVPVPPPPAPPPHPPTQAAPDGTIPWARPTSRRTHANRNRQLVRDLPGWDPLPPGEILVQRHRRT